jgi:uncharacterized membrane protein required for colicin V production
MNFLDALILGVLAISSIAAAYKGFVGSVLDLVSFFASWIAALIFSPVLSRYIIEHHPYLLQILITFSEGALRIDSIEDRTLPVSVISSERISQLVGEANFPYPFDRLLLSNLQDLALENLNTLGEYFNHSIANILLNIITFVSIYFAIRILFTILTSIARGIVGLPVLKHMDWLLGTGFGLVRGLLIVNLLFLFLSVVLVLVPVDLLRSYIENSLMADFFTEFNIFSAFLRGRI